MDATNADLVFTPSVKAVQERLTPRPTWRRFSERGGLRHAITPDLAAYLAERDSIYLGTASAAGQPYIQHRGGPKGFLHVLEENTLGLADFIGNR
jgi:predicted pyridoxine 5'-phosphate oxidase superfamily flavin-nucleotide-binding protein